MTLNKKKWLIIFILLIAITMVISIYSYKKKAASNSDQPKLVEVNLLGKAEIEETVHLLGTINPKHATLLIAKNHGTLDVLIPTGQKVRKGDLIAQINNPDIENNLELTQGSVTIAKNQYERLLGLLKTGYVSSKEVEEKKQTWLDAQKELSKAKIELDTLRFYAPFDGIVGAYKKKEGTQVNTGDSILTIYDPSTLVVDFDIPCTNISAFYEGQLVRIFNMPYKLSHLQKMIDEDSHMCPADVTISCKDCLIGASAEVELVLKEKKDIIVIPEQAIFLRNSKPHVYIVKDNVIELVPVTTGIKNKSQIEVMSGLKFGQQLVIKGLERLYPGLKVAIYHA
ncbi:efflux RND transporter periplasmic adaptor subunit [Legionella gresilensis]|uniref:efflux RND transporter periplasmic adaptor subunit n=1 Tax=Legionella gresilensis TaxID=91823 RepID=UPI0010419E86|nr:efflux RND transporter periplasmic adaptor subunit [Legionella gresilensis]